MRKRTNRRGLRFMCGLVAAVSSWASAPTFADRPHIAVDTPPSPAKDSSKGDGNRDPAGGAKHDEAGGHGGVDAIGGHSGGDGQAQGTPAPIVGAGYGAFAMLGGGYWLLRRLARNGPKPPSA